MGVFDVFFNPKAEPPKVVPSLTQFESEVKMPPPTYTLPVHGTTAVIDQNVLEKVNQKATQAASPEFQNFQRVMDRMRAIPGMSLNAQYQAAVAATGITLTQIEISITSMLQRLDQEEAGYAQVLEKITQTEVATRQGRLEKNKNQIEANEQEITRLRADIAKLEGEGLDLEQEIRENVHKIQTGAATFKSTMAYAKQQVARVGQEAAQNIPQGASQ